MPKDSDQKSSQTLQNFRPLVSNPTDSSKTSHMKTCKRVLPVSLCLLCDFTDKSSNSVLTDLVQVQFLPLVSVRILFSCLELFVLFLSEWSFAGVDIETV